MKTMNYTLYIRDKKIELSGSDLILFTYQKSDATSPTAIKTSYTKTITIPGTPSNNASFDEIYRLDRYQIGNIFNPAQREPFQLFMNGDLIESGYVKMGKINSSGGYVSYEITLYSTLGDLFYSLQTDADGNPLTLSDLDYGVDISFASSDYSIWAAWSRLYGDPLYNTYLEKKWDIINFAPAYNGLPDNSNFDASKVFVDVYGGYMPESPEKKIPLRVESGWENSGADDDYQDGWKKEYDSDGDKYTPLDGRYGVVSLPDKCTEWEVHDLRSYLQRPVIRVKAVIEAIIRFAEELGYTMTLDPEFFNDTNPYYTDSWMTLSMLGEIDKEVKSQTWCSTRRLNKDNTNTIFLDFLSKTPSPFDFLVSFAKMFNLHFNYSKVSREVEILLRKNFYTNPNNVISLEDSIDRTTMSYSPIINYDFKFLDLCYSEGKSECLEDYKTYWPTAFGTLRKDTGYDFDSGVKTEPQGIIFRNAVDARESSTYYRTLTSRYASVNGDGVEGTPKYYQYPYFLSKTGCQYSLYTRHDDGTGEIEYKEESTDIEKFYRYTSNKKKGKGWNRHTILKGNLYYRNGYMNSSYEKWGKEYLDPIPKPQFHGESNKAEDGSNVLLFFNGFSNSSQDIFYYYDSYSRKDMTREVPCIYWISDDIPAMDKAGTRGWIFPYMLTSYDSLPGVPTARDNTKIGDYDRKIVSLLPSFNRYKNTWSATSIGGSRSSFYYTPNITYSFDFGQPYQVYVPEFYVPAEACISKKYNWDSYLEDIYNFNTRTVEAEVELPSIQDALRKFYFFDGAYWIITKISDYSYGDKFAHVVFLKVNDINNYIQVQSTSSDSTRTGTPRRSGAINNNVRSSANSGSSRG